MMLDLSGNFGSIPCSCFDYAAMLRICSHGVCASRRRRSFASSASMAGADLPLSLPMHDWLGGNSVVGFWTHIGRTLVDVEKGEEMFSDYFPCNLQGDPIPTSRTGAGYWKLHLPQIRDRVDFHRQLLCDFLLDPLLGFDVHHVDENKSNNCVGNLRKFASGPHRAMHGSVGGSRSRGRGRGVGGRRLKRAW